MQPTPWRRAHRALRQSAYATFAYAVLLMWFLPALIHRDAGGWTWEPWTLLEVGLTLVVGVLTWRGSQAAAGIAAAYGLWRLGLLAFAIVRVLDGTAVQVEHGPAWVVSQLVALPFAILWVRGGLAVLRERRISRTRGADDEVAHGPHHDRS
jgi:hypothetical protein